MVTEQPDTGRRSTRRRAPAPVKPKAGETVPAEQRDAPPVVRWTTVPVPVPVGVRVPAVRLPAPHLSVPDFRLPAAAVHAARSAVNRVVTAGANLPAPRRAAYFGALGVMAVVGALEWPVAAAIGAGVWVAGQAGQDAGRSAREEPGQAAADPADRSR